MVDVILPQAIRVVIPPLTNNCINVIKDTALASVVAMPDLLKQANQAQALEANPTPLIVAALIYLALLWPLVSLYDSRNDFGRNIPSERYRLHQEFAQAVRRFNALAGVDLEIDEGEVVCIVGPSGSGKSTLIRCINQLEEFDDSSEVKIAGIDITQDETARADLVRCSSHSIFSLI